MSYTEFCSERTHTAKKAHTCDGCLTSIHPGEKYLHIAGKWDGDFCTAKYHPECREYEEKLHDQYYAHPDDYMILHEAVSEDRSVLDDAPEIIKARFQREKKS